MHAKQLISSLVIAIAVITLPACSPTDDPAGDRQNRIVFEVIGSVMDIRLNEISGIESLPSGHFVVHNDDGGPQLWLLAASGHTVGKLDIEGAKNRDWEDLTRFEYQGQSIIAVGDIGDNQEKRSQVSLYFLELPKERITGNLKPVHTLNLTYPDGPRDCEAMAYDPAAEQLLFMTKRDTPPRLYSIDIPSAMSKTELELKFLGTVPTLRPPAREDDRYFGKDRFKISRPTGMDINSDGSLAAVITYRSLYLYRRQGDQTWFEAFQKRPREFYGPRSRSEEAIAFSADMRALFISAEGRGAPIFRAALPEPDSWQD